MKREKLSSQSGSRVFKIFFCLVIMCFFFTGMTGSFAEAKSTIMHPIKNPSKYTDKGLCPNCGMMLNMWARTRYSFANSEGKYETCSIRCMADISMKADETPKNIMVALYTKPEKMVSAGDASYVVGSSAKGTMTMKSKIAFASKDEAQKFAGDNGGNVMDFSSTYAVASKELEMSRANIDTMRKKAGKIKIPLGDRRCVTCGMYPSKYPQHRAQILTSDGKTQHFCSTRCLVNYQADPKQYSKRPPMAKAVWVTVYPDGDYDYADGLYYVVGSKVLGPMGMEALPFRKKVDAHSFAKKEGGKVMRFNEVKPAMLTGGHHGMGMQH